MKLSESLIERFQNFDTTSLESFGDRLKTRTKDPEGEIFPPYLPRVGEDYRGLMLYGMAQSMISPWESLCAKTRRQKVLQLQDAEDVGDVWMAPYPVLLGLAGMLFWSRGQNMSGHLEEVDRMVAASNYYKFSLARDGRDLNPMKLGGAEGHFYREINDQLVTWELEELAPNTVITFRGLHAERLMAEGVRVLLVNDPSWILRGARGMLVQGGRWDCNDADPKAQELADSYAREIEAIRYGGKHLALKLYLLHYANIWKREGSAAPRNV